MGVVSLGKHRKSGISHNHANSIARTREVNKEMEKQAELKIKQKGKLTSNFKELFNGYN
jgi:hypothetical protein